MKNRGNIQKNITNFDKMRGAATAVNPNTIDNSDKFVIMKNGEWKEPQLRDKFIFDIIRKNLITIKDKFKNGTFKTSAKDKDDLIIAFFKTDENGIIESIYIQDKNIYMVQH